MSKQSTKKSNPVLTAEDRQLSAGIQKRMPNLALIVLGVAQTAATVEALILKRLTAIDASTQAYGAWIAAASTAREAITESDPVLAAVREYVRIQYENDATALADFGMKPRTVTPLTAEKKAAANAKRQATRAQRGEVSKAKKAAAAAQAAATPATPPAAPGATGSKSGA
jgi:hypothetical protein